MHRVVEVIGPFRHAHPRRGTDRLDEHLRGRGVIEVDHIDPEIADHGVAEGGRQQRKRHQRDADGDQQRNLVAPHPDHLADGDVDQTGPARPLHQRAPVQSA